MNEEKETCLQCGGETDRQQYGGVPYWHCPLCHFAWSVRDVGGHRLVFLDDNDAAGTFVDAGLLVIGSSEKVDSGV